LGEGKGPLCWSCPGGPHNLLFDDCEVVPVIVSVSAVCRLPPARSASPPGGLLFQRARQVKAALDGVKMGWGALVLALTPCYTCDPALEARTQQRIHEGILDQDTYI
jgi:hypothetical protein